jgi:hypothetical protein
MNNRPTSITIISWILIIIGAIALISTPVMTNNPSARELMAKNPIPIPIQYAIGYAGLLIRIVCGIAMLKGKNWARCIYIIWGLVGFIIGMTTSPMKIALIPGLLLLGAIAFFLFHPEANAYFKPKTGASNA